MCKTQHRAVDWRWFGNYPQTARMTNTERQKLSCIVLEELHRMFDHSLESCRNCETCSQRVRDGDKEESRVSSKVQLGQEWVDFGTHFHQSWASTENFGDLGSQTEVGDLGLKRLAAGPKFLPEMCPPKPPCHQIAGYAQPHIWPADPAGGYTASITLSHPSCEGGCNAIITSFKSFAIFSYLVK